MASTSPVASAGAVATAELAGRLPPPVGGTERRVAHAILIASVVLLAVPALLRVRHQYPDARRGDDASAEARALDAPAAELRRRRGRARKMGRLLAEQRDRRARGRDRQDRDLASVRVRDRLLQLPRQAGRLLDDLHHADAAGAGADRVDLSGRQRARLGRHVLGAHRPAAWRRPPARSCSASTIRPSRTRSPEAAQLDGAGPLRFLWSFLLPLSKANIAALFVILFVYGWNDYLWPLIVTNSPEMRTAVIGIDSLIPRTSQLPGVERGDGGGHDGAAAPGRRSSW